MEGPRKVVEIGSPKTGTTSLGRAFELLGLRHRGWDKQLHGELLRALGVAGTMDVMAIPAERLDELMLRKWREGAFDRILEEMRRFDAFEDGPWHFPGFFKVVDRAFPGTRFILLERDREQWLRSYRNHFGSTRPALPEDPGDPRPLVLREHLRRYDTVRAYFAQRPGDLLTMNICAGEGWEPLCRFLELPRPGVPFPHLNRSPLRRRLSTMIRATRRRVRPW
ncbi:MAG TPA: sulfotransferase [Longimicrobiaceae bacterium]|nr:sulfotransferase [Longimicrobiaceae bacterium]